MPRQDGAEEGRAEKAGVREDALIESQANYIATLLSQCSGKGFSVNVIAAVQDEEVANGGISSH